MVLITCTVRDHHYHYHYQHHHHHQQQPCSSQTNDDGGVDDSFNRRETKKAEAESGGQAEKLAPNGSSMIIIMCVCLYRQAKKTNYCDIVNILGKKYKSLAN